MPAHQLKNGKWYTSFYYRTPSGELKQKYKRSFDSKEDAEAFEKRFLETHRFFLPLAQASRKREGSMQKTCAAAFATGSIPVHTRLTGSCSM